MVAGGLLETSYTTLPISLTEFVISDEISSRSVVGKGNTSAVMASEDATARRASTYPYRRTSPATPTEGEHSAIAQAAAVLRDSAVAEAALRSHIVNAGRGLADQMDERARRLVH